MQKPLYSADEEQELMARLWAPSLKDNPLAFVLAAFPWGQPNTPLAHFKGPRRWQREVLRDLGDHIARNKGVASPEMLREAIAAGRGIGKSALVSWLILWMLTTRIGSTVIVSANSEAQLRSVTWGELTKWSTMIINAHWWEISATRLMPAKWLTDIVERDLKVGTRYWNAEGRLWSEENPDSYAGAHNHLGMMLILDEASGIPDQIWQVAAGFFTEPVPDRYWMVFSNPRRNSGYFFECFNAKRDFWKTKNIDARSVEGTDQAVYRQIIEEYGEDSPQVRIEVLGEFPLADDDQFIPASHVDEAMKRPRYNDETAPIVIGIDPARSGMDSTVIAIRQGRDLLEIRRYNNQDTMQTVGCIIEAIEEFKPTLTVIDEGGLGYGILDRLNEQRYKVRGVNFAWASKMPVMYLNKRAELWGAMRDWIKSAHLPNDRRLKADLTGVQQKMTSSGAIQLESKKDMRARGLASPDAADAIAVTFAFSVARRETVEKVKKPAYYSNTPTTSWLGA